MLKAKGFKMTEQDLQKIDNLPLTSRVSKRLDLNLMVEAKDIKELCAIVEFYRGQDTLNTINNLIEKRK